MKFLMTAHEVAANAATSALNEAISRMERAIKDCGELSAKDAKQSDANKAYFADQANVYREAVKIIATMQREIANRAAAPKPDGAASPAPMPGTPSP